MWEWRENEGLEEPRTVLGPGGVHRARRQRQRRRFVVPGHARPRQHKALKAFGDKNFLSSVHAWLTKQMVQTKIQQ